MRTEIIKTDRVTDSEKKALFALFQQFYANTNYDQFVADFAEKHWLIRMSEGSTLAGFSTQQLIELPIAGSPVRFLYSGDTIVHPDYWNKSHLAGAFGHLFQHHQTDAPLYWFLISKGFRTYRFLPVFFNAFYPSYSEKNRTLKPLLDAVAACKFKQGYNPQTELIQFEEIKDHLRGPLADIPPGRQNDPHIAYFELRNPTYRSGTELACIAPLDGNLTRCGERVIQTTEVEWHV
jgi:hypothetical protein